MQVSCPHCGRILEFSGDRPVFCAYCGKPLGDAGLALTGAYVPLTPPVGRVEPGDQTEAVPPSGRGSSPSGSAEEPDPDQIAGFRVVRLLGRGGMGSVYEAEDVAFGRRVALKLIGADHVASVEAVERFRQEGRLASTISHPRCVYVLAAEEHRGRPYIVMELMPGATLQTLVEHAGPLPVGEAIAKILDVIEGLREAHLLGVIHRDVKPSNCFLDDDGRVKVGDFGLSKSLDGDAALTRTGSFVGTPLYASPEQIKRDRVDERTDVYSVAATLYYLLTGRPPFQAGDAAAALAKIVSEDPTPMRTLRPELPAALEATVLRGLDRDRDRRWPDLEQLRDALLPFVSGGLTLADQALRVSAYIADLVVLELVHTVFFTGSILMSGGPGALGLEQDGLTLLVIAMVARGGAGLAYFGLLEGLVGASVGKRLTRLRVGPIEGAGGEPPGVGRAFLRAWVFLLVAGVPAGLTSLLLGRVVPMLVHASLSGLPASISHALVDRWVIRQPQIALMPVTLGVVGVGLLVLGSTMRAGNGYRGLHEFASGTRLVRLPRLGRRRVPRGRRPAPRHLPERSTPAAPGGVLDSVGPFAVRGAVRWDADRRVLLGEDPSLNRPVWLVLRPKGSTPPDAVRRDLGRPGRPRWLAGGEQAEYRWDAYAPQLGCTLADLAGTNGLPWADVRPILHDLADELARACADGTLPAVLSLEQIWIQPEGTVQLVDPLEARAPTKGVPAGALSGSGASSRSGMGSGAVIAMPDDAPRALELLRWTATRALEGNRRRPASATTSIRAAVPVHAARMLDRLTAHPRAGDPPFRNVAEFLAAMEADRDKPTEVEPVRRLAHLGLAALPTLPILAFLFRQALPGWSPLVVLRPWWWPFLLVPIAAAAWSATTRGGILQGLMGLALVRYDSRPASRWRCALRSAMAWAALSLVLVAATLLTRPAPATSFLAYAVWTFGLLLTAAAPVAALLRPTQSILDRLAGTWLVPK